MAALCGGEGVGMWHFYGILFNLTVNNCCLYRKAK
jgi:hypothetical protein